MSVVHESPVAIVASEAGAATGLLERLSHARRTVAAGFNATTGSLKGTGVVVAWPASGVCDFDAVLKALWGAHRPRLVVGIGVDSPGGAVASADWRVSFERACEAVSVEGVVLAVAEEADEGKAMSREAEAVARPQPFARRAGALFGALWRRPSVLKELARQKSRQWERQEELADAVERLVSRRVGRSG